MSHLFRASLVVLIVAAQAAAAEKPDADATPRALNDYVARDEPVYGWKVARTGRADGVRIDELQLTSQKWQGIVWKHVLQVFHPKELAHPEHMLLFVTGGSNGGRPDDEDNATGARLARLCGARVAILHQVPNQPLLGGHKEDDLITETWLKYLDTGDETWPLLFPMVKSAVKAMDALQEYVAKTSNDSVKGFVITGASKRGWTSWLTPVADGRVVATAPIVIDVLNFTPQMKYQRATWGKYSRQIHDYTSKGLVRDSGEPEGPREEWLWRAMDPYTYRKQLALPKLMIVGTNDPYWVVDAMNIYWDGLVGPKYVLQVPNAGHGLDGGREKALTTLGVYFRHVVAGKPLPEIRWTFRNDGEKRIVLTLQSSPHPAEALLWTARSTDKDFRDATWESRRLTRNGDKYRGEVAKPADGHVALFGEFRFKLKNVGWSLTTTVRRE